MIHARFGCRLGILVVVSLVGAAAPAQSATLAGKAATTFAGTSTLHDFEGKAATVGFTPTDDEGRRWSAHIEVPVASLNTGNSWRDKNMRSMLQAERYPSIRAAFEGIDPQTLRAQTILTFMLTIRDATRPATAVLTHWVERDNHLEFDAGFSVSLNQYGLEPPSALFVHVDDSVTVRVHVTLDRT